MPEDDGAAPAVPDTLRVHSQFHQGTGKGRKMGYQGQISGIGIGEGRDTGFKCMEVEEDGI